MEVAVDVVDVEWRDARYGSTAAGDSGWSRRGRVGTSFACRERLQTSRGARESRNGTSRKRWDIGVEQLASTAPAGAVLERQGGQTGRRMFLSAGPARTFRE